MIDRPRASEYAPFYAGYVALVPPGDVLETLAEQRGTLRSTAAAVPADRERFRYAPGKWSVREVFSHLGDAERVFGHRAFRFGRGDETPLPGFDENHYVEASGADERELAELAAELVLLREANLLMLRSLAQEAWTLGGAANGTPVTVRALAWILAGHTEHHLRVLAERYGVESKEP